MTAHRALLEELYAIAIAAAHPRTLVAEALSALGSRAERRRLAILAIGKAAPSMTEAAVALLSTTPASVVGGVIVGTDDGESPHPSIARVIGDHPVPGRRSLQAAAALANAVERARRDADAALVLISGGATSLVGAPVDGVSPGVLATLYASLLRSGWDIEEMNAVRKRFLRWGAGRLAAALAPLAVHPVILSDVIGDDPAIIASGPCTPDPLRASDIRDRLARLTIDDSSRRELSLVLDRVIAGRVAETAKPGDSAFAHVVPPVIRGNVDALAAMMVRAAATTGVRVKIGSDLRGEARVRGAELAGLLLRCAPGPRCYIYGGETTVTVGDGAMGAGGRCQELALAAAEVLDGAYDGAASIAIMAAGTDGRDGSTDAAGAIIDRDSWRLARANGVSPDAALAMHDSHRALAAAGALLPSRVTGTNVMDIVVGLVDAR